MKRILLISFLIFLGLSATYSQNVDPKHWNYYKDSEQYDLGDYKVKLSNSVARMEEAKMKVEVENTTSDFLLWKENESTFRYDFGEYQSKEKMHIIKPHSSKSTTVNATGTNQFHVDSYDFDFGGVYKVAEKGNVQEAPDFALPVAVNEFDAGAFKVKCKGADLKTGEGAVYFEVTYTGSHVGIFNGSKLVLKIPNGTEYATDNKRLKNTVMLPGDKEKFTATFSVPGKVCDMQFANMTILWKDCFSESIPEPLKGKTIKLELDPALTQAKNK